MIYLFCNFKSSGVVELQDAIRAKGIECLRIKEYHGQAFHKGPMFNWGCGDVALAPPIEKIVSTKLYNTPRAVLNSCSKVKSYRNMVDAGVWTPAVTVHESTARQWLANGRTVLARKDYGSNGAGITLVKPGSPLPGHAEFYSRLYPSTHEFRVHVAFGKVIDKNLKVKRDSESWEAQNRPYDEVIRNFNGGWRLSNKFDWNQILPGTLPDKLALGKEMENIAIAAIKANGLDFGAVDMLANFAPEFDGPTRFVACETNTAPALELASTLDAYAKAFVAQAQV